MEAYNSKMMNIYTEMTETMFDGMVSVEEVDEDKLNKLINSSLLKQTCNSFNNAKYDNEQQQLKEFQAIVKNGYAYVQHNKTEIGRSKALNGLSLLNLRREIRQTVCHHENVVDIDMDNAHPAIMLQMLKHENVKCQCLDDYVNNRQRYRDEIYKCWKLEEYVSVHGTSLLKDMPKYLMIRLMYGGTVEGWEKQYNLRSPKQRPIIITNFIEEFKNICEEMKRQNSHIEDMTKSKKDYNIEGSLTSQIMQQKESQILEVITKYLIRRNIIETVKPGYYKYAPCADGLIINKKNFTSIDLLLAEIKVEIFIETGFIINLSTKPMEQHYCDVLEDSIISHAPCDSINKVDRILNRTNKLFEAYRESPYYNTIMTRNDVNTKHITLTTSDNVKCTLCKVVHKETVQKLYYNKYNHICLKCHKKKIVIKKNDNKEQCKILQVEEATKHIQNFYDVKEDDEVSLITEDSKYISCDDSNKFQWRNGYKDPFIILDAQMGKGKTVFIKEFLRRNNAKSILIVSQRKSYTQFITNELEELGIVSYLDVPKNKSISDYDRVCVQVESLHKIKDKKEYDVVILDEIETILNQYSSTTMVHGRETFELLEHFILKAKHTIMADAFITTRTIEYVKSMKTRRDNVTMIKNTRPFLEKREAIQIHGRDFIPLVLEALKEGY